VRTGKTPAKPSSFPKRGIKSAVGRLEVDVFDELARLTGTVVAVHTHVLPFDQQWSVVVDGIEGTDGESEAGAFYF
jgi:uncharacterized protein with von Willebrand factor type A (vWA) domain